MSTKQKILVILDDVLDDVSEQRLLDILLDAYQARQAEIKKLKSEIAYERENLHRLQESTTDEYRRMRSDPLYGAFGEYFFELPGKQRQFFCVRVQGKRFEMFERKGNVDFMCRQMSREEWK